MMNDDDLGARSGDRLHLAEDDHAAARSVDPSSARMTAHTPGVWIAFDDEIVARALGFVAEFQGDPRCALNCQHAEALAAEVHRLREVDAELLAALKVTLNYWTSTGFAECEPDCDCIVESVRAAIAKAEATC